MYGVQLTKESAIRLSMKDLRVLALKKSCNKQIVIDELSKRYKNDSTHFAAKTTLISIEKSTKKDVADLAKAALIGLETAYANKKANLDGPNFTTLQALKPKKEAAKIETKKNSKKNTSKRYR